MTTTSAPSLATFLERARQTRLLVVGDVMLDRYWFGEVSRISPEAPVPIVKITHQEERLGGAANVALNARAFGTQTSLLSVVGNDDAGATLRRLVKDSGIDGAFFVDDKIDTVVKLRVIGRQQQLLRIDFETPPSHEVLNAKLKDFAERLQRCDAVLLSDYGKGGLTHIHSMIDMARAASVPVLVDPKGEDFAKYSGATILTPNRAELRQVIGAWHSEQELHEKVEALRHKLNIEALLLTRSEEGMTLFAADSAPLHQAAQALEVFDVSGAGDTVIATLSVMRMAGASWAEAIHYANLAAGIVVGKLGTAAVNCDELLAADAK